MESSTHGSGYKDGVPGMPASGYDPAKQIWKKYEEGSKQ